MAVEVVAGHTPKRWVASEQIVCIEHEYVEVLSQGAEVRLNPGSNPLARTVAGRAAKWYDEHYLERGPLTLHGVHKPLEATNATVSGRVAPERAQTGAKYAVEGEHETTSTPSELIAQLVHAPPVRQDDLARVGGADLHEQNVGVASKADVAAQLLDTRQVLEAHAEVMTEVDTDAVAKQLSRRCGGIAERCEKVVRGIHATHAAVTDMQQPQYMLALALGSGPRSDWVLRDASDQPPIEMLRSGTRRTGETPESTSSAHGPTKMESHRGLVF